MCLIFAFVKGWIGRGKKLLSVKCRFTVAQGKLRNLQWQKVGISFFAAAPKVTKQTYSLFFFWAFLLFFHLKLWSIFLNISTGIFMIQQRSKKVHGWCSIANYRDTVCNWHKSNTKKSLFWFFFNFLNFFFPRVLWTSSHYLPVEFYLLPSSLFIDCYWICYYICYIYCILDDW